MSEIAMVSAKKSRLETDAKRGDKLARKALKLGAEPGKFLSTVQIGITLIGILTGIYSGEEIQDHLSSWVSGFPQVQPYAKSIATLVILVGLTYFSLVLGELLPKRIGMAIPEKISKVFAYPMDFLSKVTAPFIWLLTLSSDLLLKVLPFPSSRENTVTEEEIKALVKEGNEGGVVQDIEHDIVERVFNLGDRKVSSLMTHRSELVFLKADEGRERIMERVMAEMHAIYPVLSEQGELVGMVHLKDIFKHFFDVDFNLMSIVKEPNYIVENLSAYEALKDFKSRRFHQSFVIDEFGDLQGIVTMNDLLEALVGDVDDFHGTDFQFMQREDGSWLVDGQFPLAELLHKFEKEELLADYPFNTLSGLILDIIRKIPVSGEKLQWLNYELEIMDMDGVRIDKVLIRDIGSN